MATGDKDFDARCAEIGTDRAAWELLEQIQDSERDAAKAED